MIKIRYRDPNELSPGLHAAAERRGRNTTVYLLSGLSAAQRRAALRRLKISARRGYDPKLPTPQLALALAADRVRTTVGRAGAVFRSHPAGSTVPVMVISAGAIAFLALSAVSIHVIHTPRDPSALSSAEAAGIVGPGAGPDATVRAGPGGTTGPGTSGINDPDQGGSAVRDPDQPGSSSPAGDPAVTSNDGNGNGTGGSNGSGTGTDPSSDAGTGGTTLTGGEAPKPTPGGDATSAAPATSDPATPAADPTTTKPSPTPSTSKPSSCLDLGPLGVCL
jgi:hypothetical protein